MASSTDAVFKQIRRDFKQSLTSASNIFDDFGSLDATYTSMYISKLSFINKVERTEKNS